MSATSFQDGTDDIETPLRKRWMSACARTPLAQLKPLIAEIDTGVDFEVLRPAEEGLVMVRARAGGTGQKFNMGEMTVTRCTVRSEGGRVGHGYVAGRHKTHAEIAARLDVLLQNLEEDRALQIVEQLERAISEVAQARQQKSAATRVEFFTMVRGDLD